MFILTDDEVLLGDMILAKKLKNMLPMKMTWSLRVSIEGSSLGGRLVGMVYVWVELFADDVF